MEDHLIHCRSSGCSVSENTCPWELQVYVRLFNSTALTVLGLTKAETPQLITTEEMPVFKVVHLASSVSRGKFLETLYHITLQFKIQAYEENKSTPKALY